MDSNLRKGYIYLAVAAAFAGITGILPLGDFLEHFKGFGTHLSFMCRINLMFTLVGFAFMVISSIESAIHFSKVQKKR